MQPASFLDDCNKIHNLIQGVGEAAKSGQEKDLAHARVLAEKARQFVERWSVHSANPEVHASLTEFGWWAKSARNHLEEIFLVNQVEVLQARSNWLIAEGMSKALQTGLADCPPERKTEMETLLKQRLNIDPAFDQMVITTCKKQFLLAVKRFTLNWPEESKSELFQQFQVVDQTGISSWIRRLSDEMRQLKIRAMAESSAN